MLSTDPWDISVGQAVDIDGRLVLTYTVVTLICVFFLAHFLLSFVWRGVRHVLSRA